MYKHFFYEVNSKTTPIMKISFAIAFLLFTRLFSFAQEFSLPLFFEDAVGNKDTLIFGFDPSATFGIDAQLSELNIIEFPLDTIFNVFFSDAVSIDDGCSLQLTKIPTYISKSQYINPYEDFYMELGLHAKNMPVSVSWDSTKTPVFEQSHLYSDVFVIMTSWNPPGGWFDGICCSGNWPNGYTFLSEKSNLILDENNFCRYTTNNFNDSINLFYIGLFQYTSSEYLVKQKEVNCIYNEADKVLNFFNLPDSRPLKIQIYNTWGKLVLEDELVSTINENNSLRINSLFTGIYLVKLSSENKYLQISNNKIFIN